MLFSSKNQNKITVVTVLLITALLTMGWFGIETVEDRLKENLRAQLKSNLTATILAFNIWAKDKKLDAETLASQPLINKEIQNLIAQTKSIEYSRESLLKSKTLSWLRTHLGKSCWRYGFIGFVIFDLEGNQVGALFDEPIGENILSKKSGFFFKSVRGETTLTLPFRAEVSLPDINGKLQKNWPTMFVSTPVISENGKIVGVLALRLRPEIELSEVMTIGRFGESGESYIFDEKANLLSKSRFDSKLKETRLIKDSEISILNIQIRNPGRNLIKEPLNSNEDPSSWPLTQMAQSVLEQTTDENVNGYPDYRGVPVVGAWTWIPEYRIGFTTEIDQSEAYRPIDALVTWFMGLGALLLVACLIGWRINAQYQNSRQEALQNEKRLKTIMNGLQDSIVAIDEKGIILSASPSVKDRFGFSENELLGQNVKMLMPEPYHSEHDGYLEAYKRTGKAKIINMMRILEGKRKDGSTFPLELRVTETQWDGSPQYTGIMRDITDLKQSEEKLKVANQELERRIEKRTEDLKRATSKAERNSAAKTEFLSRMSHELRTPMNAILGFSQLLGSNKAHPLSSHQSSQVNEIMKAGRHLLELINEVLDLASIESGKITLSPEPVCMVDLMNEVLAVVEPLASQYEISLVNEVEKHHMLFVKADKVRAKQVLLNLISNGIKYNRVGGSVTLSVDNDDEKFLRVNIQDTGMGIPKEKIQNIFEPFDRLGAEITETEGTGIGMTISRKLMEVMNGTISVDSIPGEGSCFYITFPKCDPPKEIVPLKEMASGESNLLDQKTTEIHTLLYVEDNPANLRLVEDYLAARPDIRFLSASQAELGLELARAHRPDLIILDINLPELDGFKVLKHLQNYDETYEIPTIALSANAMAKDIKKGLNAGFKEYLTKPLDMEKFLKVIEKYLPAAQSVSEE